MSVELGYLKSAQECQRTYDTSVLHWAIDIFKRNPCPFVKS